MITTTTALPPEIKQFFNFNLFYYPCIGDNLEKIWRKYLYVKNKLFKKARHNPAWQEKLAHLEKQFLEIYERAKAKKENPKTKTENKTEEPFYFIRMPRKGDNTIFSGLRYYREET